MFYLRYLCLFAESGVQRILCCVFLFCFSCVSNVVSFSGLSILDSPFGFLYRLFKNSNIYKINYCN